MWGYGVRVVVAVVDDHAARRGHGVEEHVVACENSDDTVAVDTDVAFDDYCSCHILDADGVDHGSLGVAADNLAPKKDRGAAVVVVLSGHDKAAAAGDTFGVVAGYIDVGDSLPQL